MAMVAADKAKKPETGEIGKKPASSASQQPEFTSAASETASKKQTVSKTEFFAGAKDLTMAEIEDKLNTEITNQGVQNVPTATVSAIAQALADSQANFPSIDAKITEIVTALGQIAQAAGTYTHYAFETLANPDIAALFVSDPSTVTDSFAAIAQATGTEAGNVFALLSNPSIAPLFVQSPDAFAQIAQAAGTAAGNAFSALSISSIAALFASDPSTVTNDFVAIAQAAGTKASFAFFVFLTNPGIAPLFVQSPDAFVQIAQAAGTAAGNAFSAFANPDIAALFASDPSTVTDSFAAIAQATGTEAGNVFAVLSNPSIAPLFVQHTDEFVQIVQAAGTATGSAFSALSKPDIAALFASDPSTVTNDFVAIAQAAGTAAGNAFNALSNPDIAALFVSDPSTVTDSFATIAQATGTEAGYAFSVLSYPSIAPLFVQHTDEFVQIAQAAGTAAGSAFNALSKPDIAALLASDPNTVINSFAAIAQAAGTLASTAFNALVSNDLIIDQFASNPGAFASIIRCFFNPALFDDPANNALFKIDSNIAAQMIANSPDWASDYVTNDYGFADHFTIAALALAHPDEEIVGTIFETTHITYFSRFTQAQLEHFYFDKDTPTGKPLFFGVLTTHGVGVDFMANFRGSDINDNFDVRFIQPGTTDNLVSLFKQTAERLGVQPKDVDSDGQKFKLFVVLAHGMLTTAGYLKSMGLSEGDVPSWDIPEYFNSADVQQIVEIGKYYDKGRAYFKECSPAGEWQDNGMYYNIAETVAEYAGMKVWGAQWPTFAVGGGPFTTFGMDGADYTVLDVNYGSVARNSYDYLNSADLPLSSWSAKRAGTSVNLSWAAQNAPNTVGYDVERSTDGVLFERVGLVEKNSTGAYSFTDGSPPAGDVYYRIKQRNAAEAPAVDGSGSLDYTFAFSEAKKAEDALVLSETEQPKLSLGQNYPNPVITSVTNTTSINYTLSEDSDVTLKVYDLQGREVAVLKDKEKQVAGEQSVSLDVSNLAAGVYAYTLTSGSTTLTKKMMIEK